MCPCSPVAVRYLRYWPNSASVVGECGRSASILSSRGFRSVCMCDHLGMLYPIPYFFVTTRLSGQVRSVCISIVLRSEFVGSSSMYTVRTANAFSTLLTRIPPRRKSLVGVLESKRSLKLVVRLLPGCEVDQHSHRHSDQYQREGNECCHF